MEKRLRLEWLTPCSDGLREDSITVNYDPATNRFTAEIRTDQMENMSAQTAEAAKTMALGLAHILDTAKKPDLEDMLLDFFNKHLRAQKCG